MPYFSIIIPAYNEEKYLRKTLHSIKQQTFQDYEVIVVANGCTDGTEEIVNKRAGGKVRLLSLPKPNVCVARNAGALNAQGKVLVFLDADTQLAPPALASIKEKFTLRHAMGTTRVQPDQPYWKYTLMMGFKNILMRTAIYKGFGGIVICHKDHFQNVQGYDPEFRVKEHHHLRRKLQEKGKYVCVDTMVTTSMRRFHQWPLWKAGLFWMKENVKFYARRPVSSAYESVR